MECQRGSRNRRIRRGQLARLASSHCCNHALSARIAIDIQNVSLILKERKKVLGWHKMTGVKSGRAKKHHEIMQARHPARGGVAIQVCMTFFSQRPLPLLYQAPGGIPRRDSCEHNTDKSG